MATKRYYVAGVDSSTQSCKVVICDPATGEVVRQGRASHPDGTQVHPDHWWEAFLAAAEAAGGLDDVAALSVGGQQHGLVCLDADGNVIRPALLWNDTRSAPAAQRLREDMGEQWWARETGCVPVASFTLTKLAWLAEHEPDSLSRLAAVCLPHDWLTWKIQGAPGLDALVTDRSDASGTCYVGTDARTYRRDILARVLGEDVARSLILPRILGPREVAGYGGTQQGWGDIVIGPGCGDNAGAALGLGLGVGDAMVSLGTSGVVAAVSADPVCDPSGLVAGFADATGAWLPLACTLNASRIIDAMARILGVDYDTFDELALSVTDAAGLRLEPYFEGERTPNLPDATATLSGMTLANSDPAHVARAGVDGLLSLMRVALDAVRDLGAPIDRVALVGGGAKSRAVRELAPVVWDAEVTIPEPGEYVALGAARQAASVRG
ncbi:xylulose kinase [Nanchangia anserum]|uniref:Xylulose kinase n=1 Tax=Nanchangia anserum TaxID=2692125 RepID=A0A8I0KNR1_9ACTO|nr:FGGY family carbohydrate kinase [Nanchangia anserum]MBD3689556.1 xylulose kinase [Nanchangia anserum]QOX81743.1 xylulose kinase [Nanchangia anserum]